MVIFLSFCIVQLAHDDTASPAQTREFFQCAEDCPEPFVAVVGRQANKVGFVRDTPWDPPKPNEPSKWLDTSVFEQKYRPELPSFRNRRLTERAELAGFVEVSSFSVPDGVWVKKNEWELSVRAKQLERERVEKGLADRNLDFDLSIGESPANSAGPAAQSRGLIHFAPTLAVLAVAVALCMVIAKAMVFSE
jgi:hypothetical protein